MFKREMQEINDTFTYRRTICQDFCIKDMPRDLKEMTISLGSVMFAYADMFNVSMTAYYSDIDRTVRFQFDDRTEPKHLSIAIIPYDIKRFKASRQIRSHIFERFRLEFDRRFLT